MHIPRIRLNIIKRDLLKNNANIRYYRPLNYDSEPTNIEKIKKYDLPIEVINTLKEHEISINNIEKQLIENNKLIYSLLKEKINQNNDYKESYDYLLVNPDEKKLIVRETFASVKY